MNPSSPDEPNSGQQQDNNLVEQQQKANPNVLVRERETMSRLSYGGYGSFLAFRAAQQAADEIDSLVEYHRADHTDDTEVQLEVFSSVLYNSGCPQCHHHIGAPDCDKYGYEFHPAGHPHGSFSSDQWKWSGYRTRALLRVAKAAADNGSPNNLPRYSFEPTR